MRPGWIPVFDEWTQRRAGIETVGALLVKMGRVTEAEFEVIEPTKSNDEHRDESAGDGTNTGSPGFRPRSVCEIFDAYYRPSEG